MGVVINEVVDVCVSVGKMVSPVVCNSSPEGFILPSAPQTTGRDSTDHDGLQFVGEELVSMAKSSALVLVQLLL